MRGVHRAIALQSGVRYKIGRMGYALLAPKFLVLYALLSSAAFVHFRGRVRHSFRRQLTDHSTFIAPYNALVYLTSGVPNTPILKVEDFPELLKLRENWKTIRDEARNLYEGEHIRGARKYNDVAFNTFFKRGWKRFYLKWYGDAFPSARELCPATVKLVESMPSINAALFALLPPGGVLGEHRDPFGGSLRYHLGLMTPNDDKCRIYLDGTPYSWRDGEDVLFDETYIHSARNETDKTRIILFCDVVRPIRSPVMRWFNAFVTRHIVKATATQNTDAEKVGIVNRVSSLVYGLRNFFQSVKRINRRLYYLLKFALIITVVYYIFVWPLIW